MAQITYTNKETLNAQPSIADKNKVKADDMNEIKSVVNTNYGEVGDITNLTTTNKTSVVNAINELKDGEIYSTNEVKTNKVWIDGKPIYRRVENITTASTDATVWTNLFSIPNIDNLINCYGYFTVGNIRTPIPRYESGTYSINFLVQDGYLKYRCYGFHSYSGYLIVEYTKA